MKLIDRLRFRTRALRRTRIETEFDDEIQFHVERETQENVARGMNPAEARLKAIREFGVRTPIKEELREVRGLNILDTMAQDIRYGIRLLLRNPGFATAAALTIALAIGATTAVFSVVYGIVLRPLPYRQPERLVSVWSDVPAMNLPRVFVGAANYRDWRTQNDVFEDMALVRQVANFNIHGTGEPERLLGARVTASIFPVLGVSPVLGRPFREAEEQDGNDKVVILSHKLWARRFNRDAGLLGRTISLNGEPHVVVGVMAPDFAFPGREFELWVPLTIDPDDYRTRTGFNFRAVGRLKHGVTIEQAQANLTAVSQRLEQQYPQNRGIGALVLPLQSDVVGDARTPLLVLLGAVSSLLLIGCASLANLLIARAVSRSSELVLRAALGASRGRLIRQSLTELVPLLALGGLAGLLLAHWLVSLTIPVLPSTLPRVESIAVSGPVLVFAALAVMLTGLAIGIWPALQAGRWDIAAALRESLRGSSTTLRGGRIRDALVVAQIAVAVTLLISSTLLMRSFATLKAVDPGFRVEGVTTLHLAIPRTKYGDDARVAAFCRDILTRVRQLPGVRSAGMVNRLPLAGVNQTGSLELERSVFVNGRIESADFRTITPGYLETMSIPLVEGRTFSEADHADAPLVGLIDARTAKAAWPNESPIGRRFRLGFIGPDAPWMTIVGVVGSIKHDGLTADQRPQFYWNYLQRAQDRMVLTVRTDGDPKALTSSVVAAIRETDPEQPVYDVRTMAAVVEVSVAQQWLTTAVLVGFATLSLIVATVGVYGVVAYNVAQRSREFGVRMALGAARSDVLLMIVSRTARLVLGGAFIGTLGALASAFALRTLLYGVAPTDWLSYLAAIGALTSAALLATALPAVRASRFNPSEVLRAG